MSDHNSQWDKGLSKSRNIWGRISHVFQRQTYVDAATLEELKEMLLQADVGIDISDALLDAAQKGLKNADDPLLALRQLLIDQLRENARDDTQSNPSNESPHVILVVGVNGTGKTTTIGKLAFLFKRQGKKVLLAAADTFRAAASEQLEIWSQRAGVDLIQQKHGADPAAVAYDALEASIARGVDVLLIDTAGRLHNKANLMEELSKIRRVLKKRLESAPHEVLLVLDATTGQNGLRQAVSFTETAGVTGIVLTKLDGTAKGGIILAIQKELGIPVQFVGVGETIDDLLEFNPEAFVDGLLKISN
ncbi:signal recognition particle-docking protein FtsY [candidate division KSB1 bacterium]|nr:signal recognition particle-docking protein FtsY [candidate division KSB1 bacterium]